MLDKKDKKLIYELDFNARMPLTQLARKIGVSKQVAKYRLENLQKKKIIRGFYTDINSSKLGYEIYLIYLKFQNFNPKIEKGFIKHVSEQESIGVNASINGKWDYCIGIWARNVVDFKKRYEEIMKKYEKYVKEKIIMIETDFYYFKPRRILESKSGVQVKMSEDITEFNLDETDKKILLELSRNSRISLVDLSSKTKLTPNGVNQRIKSLEKKGIILSYRIMINYPLLNFLHHRIFLHLNDLTLETKKKLINFLGNQKETISITETIGYCDLEFRAILENIQEFYNLIEKIRNEFPTLIKNYDSIIYYKFHQTLDYFPFN